MEKIIHELRAVEIEILDVIHQVCMDNGLKYSLAYGTLIGAVRHEGFIPWDDDIDIMMPREDYDRLLTIWKDAAPQEFILQDCYSSPDLVNNFAKVRKNHTTFLQFEFEKEKNYHKGVFVDIFPMDRVPQGRLARRFQFLMCAINLLYNRGYRSGNNGIMDVFERILLKAPKSQYRKRQKWAERKATLWNYNTQLPYFSFCTIGACKVHYPADLFDELISLPFNGKKYYVVKKYDTCLQALYGNYRELPPEEERVWKHHPILVDFEHNYEELIKGNEQNE